MWAEVQVSRVTLNPRTVSFPVSACKVWVLVASVPFKLCVRRLGLAWALLPFPLLFCHLILLAFVTVGVLVSRPVTPHPVGIRTSIIHLLEICLGATRVTFSAPLPHDALGQ